MEYAMENECLQVKVKSMGAELCSVVDKATGAQMLWQGDPAVWAGQAPILFPYCGKLKGDRFTHAGRIYEGAQHGFARRTEHALTGQDGQSLTFALQSGEETLKKYPFPFRLENRYTLAGRTLCHSVRVENTGSGEMNFAFGFHPAFLCPFDSAHTAADYSLQFDTPQTPLVVEVGEEDRLVTGKTWPYFERQTDIPLQEGMFDHDSTCFTGLDCKTLSLVERDTGRRVSVRVEGFPFVLMWSARGPIRYVCIEPWHGIPDAREASGVFSEKPHTIHLAPGGSWGCRMEVTFDR